MAEASTSRSLIGHQPARVVLLDVSSPHLTCQAGSGLCDALENVLCIGANMAGPSRIPLVGIYLLSSYPEIILPLSCTKGNFVRMHAAVDDIRSFLAESLPSQRSGNVKPCIAQAVSEACGQFRRHTSSLAQVPGHCRQLEVIILTGHAGHVIQAELRHLPDQFDLSAVKRILAATVSGPIPSESSVTCEDEMALLPMDCGDVGGMVDTVMLESDTASLQKFFYTWLIETSSEAEHMHLLLPPPSPADPDLVIKCDISERMISPSQLPFHETFNIHTESTIYKPVYPPPSKALGMTVPLQKLKVVSVIRRQCVCDSVLFGLPMTVLPTTCWKMDWDVLETNQENFHALCSTLHQQDQVLLTQSVGTSEESPHKPSKLSPASRPSGFFVLMPSENNRSLLVKSVVPQELLLPANHVMTTGLARPESILRLQSSLSEVPVLPELQPLGLTSGLIPALCKASLPRSAVDKARAAKRKADAGTPHSKADALTSGQQDISNFLLPCRPGPASQGQQKAPLPGGRLTANHWSSPLASYNKTGAADTSRPGDRRKPLLQRKTSSLR